MNKVYLVTVIILVLLVLLSGCSVPKYNRVTLWWSDMKADGYFDKKTGDVKISVIRFISDKNKKEGPYIPVEFPDVSIKTSNGIILSLSDIANYTGNKYKEQSNDDYELGSKKYYIDSNFMVIIDKQGQIIFLCLSDTETNKAIDEGGISCLYDPVTKKEYHLPLKYEDAILLFGEPQNRADWFTW